MNLIKVDSEPGKKEWYAVHIHLPHSHFDDYLRQVVRPAVYDNCLDGDFFFLRYWQGGSHLRIRYRLDDNEISTSGRFLGQLRDGIPKTDKRGNHEYAEAAQLQATLAKLEGEESLAIRPVGCVERMPYIPEVKKYGGTSGVNAAEQIFCSTSLEVLRLLMERSRREAPQSPPLGEALYVAAMFLAGANLDVKDSISFLEHYEAWWSRYSTAEHQAAWPRVFDRISGNLNAICRKAWFNPPSDDPLFSLSSTIFKTLQNSGTTPATSLQVEGTPYLRCLSNYIHTTNNRLGLTPAGEALVAYLLRRSLTLEDQRD
ncbi:lantibiotic dehydratase C-terminal domain-containing protein [Corynebacterium rhinophilum]|uniref:lantibiotic dehydratase C-terminal domain-containing protein n=1 Tax=Corynebacterium rhinophilum TaxID=3050197 RepID=UPI00254E20FB|nr:lantibiotic dehydratase C-terminal domain-containing protein [Corynebacterium sp. MSK192]MDK8699068.1 lantibiotic dehydratase C-terminal domain-containing protein [Corynebacterium sp. MSK192]